MFHRYMSLNRYTLSVKQNNVDGKTKIGISVQLAGDYKQNIISNMLPNLCDTLHSY